MTANASITTQHLKNVLLVPTSAIHFTPYRSKDSSMSTLESSHVWILENNKIKNIPISTRFSQGQWTEVINNTPLKKGMRVITGYREDIKS